MRDPFPLGLGDIDEDSMEIDDHDQKYLVGPDGTDIRVVSPIYNLPAQSPVPAHGTPSNPHYFTDTINKVGLVWPNLASVKASGSWTSSPASQPSHLSFPSEDSSSDWAPSQGTDGYPTPPRYAVQALIDSKESAGDVNPFQDEFLFTASEETLRSWLE